MSTIDELLVIVRALRDPQQGCPWDLRQDFATIAPYTIEEAYEVADAIERGHMQDLRDELGDLLFQVVFHARLAEEGGHFDFDDVVRGLCGKMTRRHPHVFADAQVADVAAQSEAWEEQKAAEREAAGAQSVLSDVPHALPALKRAAKLGKRAARVGFDWPELSGVRAKVDEELAELDAELAGGGDATRVAEELGDVLFAVANLARHAGVDPETALRGTNRRFVRRFGSLERDLRQTGRGPADADLDELEAAWQRAKHRVG